MPKISEKPFGEIVSIVGLDHEGNVRKQAIVNLATDIIGATIPPETTFIQTSGYYKIGDGGGAVYKRVPENGHLVSHDGAMWAVTNLDPNIRMFGARGDGSDATTAIELAHSYVQSIAYSKSSEKLGWDSPAAALIIPPGHYVYKGSGLKQTGGSVILLAKPRTALIEITADVFFLTSEGRVTHTYVSGITFLGGKGALRYLNTAHNVTCFHVFSDCIFQNYTVCAIGNNSSDHPELKVERCLFYGSVQGGTIGIAWGGYIDGLTVVDCVFLLNKYHLKIGPRLSGSINITRNDFIAFRRGIRAADIWIVPNVTEKDGINSGAGFVIAENKFGNENEKSDDPRILIATEDDLSGSDRLTRHHTEQWVSSGGYASGVQIQNNRIDGIGGLTSPFIKCYINDFWRLTFNHNTVSGGVHTYLCQFMGASREEENGYETRTWEISLGSHSAASRLFSIGVSNRVMGLYEDRFGSEQGSPGSLLFPNIGDDAGYVSLANAIGYVDLQVFGGSKRPVIDALGAAPRAAEIVIERINSYASCKLSELLPERMTWLEIDLMKSHKFSVQAVVVQIRNVQTKAVAMREQINLNPFWQTARIPFISTSSSRSNKWECQITAKEYIDGSADRYCIGRLRIYHARQSMVGGHLRTLGTGTWDGEHLILGKYHLWVDASERLRINHQAPISDTDGVIVGA